MIRPEITRQFIITAPGTNIWPQVSSADLQASEIQCGILDTTWTSLGIKLFVLRVHVMYF